MTLSRRNVLKFGAQFGVAASTSMLWFNPISARALEQASVGTDYKAIVVITMTGGNDGNNTIVPLDAAEYARYASLRTSLALPASSLIPLASVGGEASFGLHPALVNVAALYNSRRAVIVANIGPIARPTTKAEVLADYTKFPGASLSHSIGIQQWESAQTQTTGWGGRVADYLAPRSGSVAPVLSSANSLFNVGKSVQATAVQNGSAFTALSPALNSVIAQIAQSETSSNNLLTQQVAAVRARAMRDQQALDAAASYRVVRTSFGTSKFSQSMKKIAALVAGRSVLGADRQIFYVQQGGYDTHVNQLAGQSGSLADLDSGVGSFFSALDEIGMSDNVLVCTHSDFCRTLQANITGGTDHAWGNHHFILGGGSRGGRIIGEMPPMELNGTLDVNGIGIWLPTQSVTQMTAGIGGWLGLSPAQLADVFPDLRNFPSAIQLS